MDDQIKERIRDASDIVEIVGQCVPLKKAGSAYKACCPFHEEKTPSFTVSDSRQMWHCFGCGAGGDVFAFVMQYHGMTFPEALRYLGDRAGIALPERHEPRGEIGRDVILRVHEQYAAWYQDVLLRQETGRGAREYLQARGVHVDTAKEFGLGFAPDSWTGASEHPELQGLDRKAVMAAGLAKPRQDGSAFDYFRNRIMFPIHGPAGDIVAFGGRTIGEDTAKYLNSPETPVYRKGSQLYNLHRARRAIQQAGRAVLVEGYFDAIQLAAAGIGETVATCGTALTEQQAKVLARHAQTVILAYDGDPAGMAAAEKAAGLLFAADLEVRVLALPDGQDPDDYVQHAGADAFRDLLTGAQDFVDFVLRDETAVRSRDADTRARYADRLMALTARIPHPVRRSAYEDKIANRLGVERVDLHGLARNAGAPPVPAPEPAARSRPIVPEGDRDLLRHVFAHLADGDYLRHLASNMTEVAPAVRAIVERICAAAPAYASEDAVLAAAVDPDEAALIRECLLQSAEARCHYAQEWVTGHMDLRRGRAALAALRRELQAAEAEGDTTRVTELAQQLTTLHTVTQAHNQALHAVEVEP